MSDIASFTFIALLLVISPGPNSILILKTLSADGHYPAIANILGLTTATFIHGAFAIFGLAALLLQSSAWFLAIKIMGAAYLTYIGFKAIFDSFRTHRIVATRHIPTRPTVPTKRSRYLTFYIEGFLTQLFNPKVSMFYLAAFPQFLTINTRSYFDAFILVSIHAVIILFWYLGLATVAVKLAGSLKSSHPGRWIQRVSGSMLVCFGGLLLTQEASR